MVRAVLALGDDEENPVRHARSQSPEERAVEVGRRAVRVVGPAVAVGEEIPVGLARLAPGHAAQRDARLAHATALLADLLALVVGKLREEILEAAVARVSPVELHAQALEQPLVPKGLRVRLGREEHVQRRGAGLLREGEQRAGEFGARSVVGGEQARALGRREGHRREELREVVEAVALVGVRPGPVEHVFAVGVGLHVERHRPGQGIAAPERQVPR